MNFTPIQGKKTRYPARVDAVYRNGVLHIAIPKQESSKLRRIEVKEVN